LAIVRRRPGNPLSNLNFASLIVPPMPRLISAFMIPATESPGERQRCRSLPHRSVTWMSLAVGTVVSGRLAS
jgi:hypothetical protein